MKKILSEIIAKLNIPRQNQKTLAKAILDRDNFIKLIEMERHRVHRSDQQFSLVLISVDGNNNGNVVISNITKKISKRMRRIDRIGWYDDTHLGVLLPNTTYAGAQVFLEGVELYKEETNGDLNIITMSYP